jgi:membrane carboxypeptidase/penicillin-binding protein PbpC
MGERGKNDEMKHRKTNFETVSSDHEKAETEAPHMQDPMGRPTTPPNKPHARLGREVQARIGQQLRAMYDDVVNQGVPDNIQDLMRRLGDQDKN